MKSEDSPELKKYIDNNLKPVIEPLIISLLATRPTDIIESSLEFLKCLQKSQKSEENSKKSNSNNSEEEEEEKGDYIDDSYLLKISKKGRCSISAEAYGEINKYGDFKPRIIQKSEEQKEQIKKRLLKSFLFSSLGYSEMLIVIQAMDQVHFKSKDIVIKQGDDGDNLYIVEEGNLKCYRSINKNEEPKFIKDYGPGEGFGELALLYNSPRAATIIAETNCTLLSLDRETFNHIVKSAAINRRNRYESLLKSVNIFQNMDPYEKSKLADVFIEKNYKKDDIIIKQGDKGDFFYILAEGEAYALKELSNNSNEIVMEYKKGDYFGELALMNDQARAATIIAKTDCKTVCIDKESFIRMLGTIEDILKRNIDNYKKFS